MRGHQQVVARHGDTLHRHQVFRPRSLFVRVLVHLLDRQADQHCHRRAGDPRIRARDIGGDFLRIIPIGRPVGFQPFSQCSRDPVFGLRAFKHSEPPRLAVVRGGRPTGQRQQPPDDFGIDMILAELADRAPTVGERLE